MNDTPAPAPAGPEAAKLAPVPPSPAHRRELAKKLRADATWQPVQSATRARLLEAAAALDALSPAPLHGRGWHDFESDMGGRFCVHCGGTLVGHGAINAPASPAPPAEPERWVRCVDCLHGPSLHAVDGCCEPGCQCKQTCRAPASPAPRAEPPKVYVRCALCGQPAPPAPPSPEPPKVVDLMAALEESVRAAKAARRPRPEEADPYAKAPKNDAEALIPDEDLASYRRWVAEGRPSAAPEEADPV